MTVIDDLPNELYPLIFKSLNLIDLAKCRSVSKTWKVKEQMLDSDQLGEWYHTKKPIELVNLISLNLLSRSSSRLQDSLATSALLENLRRLKLSSDLTYLDLSSRFLCYLVRFKKLEHLELDYGIHDDVYNQVFHPNLRILDINRWIDYDMKFVIDTPQLDVLYVNGYFDNISIRHPSSIRHLTVHYYQMTGEYNDYYDGYSFDGEFNLSYLDGLEYLECDFYLEYEQDLLFDSPNLKKLVYHLNSNEPQNRDRLSAALEFLSSVMQQTDERHELQIFCEGVQITSADQITEQFLKELYVAKLKEKIDFRLIEVVELSDED